MLKKDILIKTPIIYNNMPREELQSVSVTVHSIAANSNVSRHLESPLAMDEIHSVQNVHPHS